MDSDQLTRHGRFWALGALKMVDFRELEELELDLAICRRENERLMRDLVMIKNGRNAMIRKAREEAQRQLESRLASVKGLDEKLKAADLRDEVGRLRRHNEKLLGELVDERKARRACEGAK